MIKSRVLYLLRELINEHFQNNRDKYRNVGNSIDYTTYCFDIDNIQYIDTKNKKCFDIDNIQYIDTKNKTYTIIGVELWIGKYKNYKTVVHIKTTEGDLLIDYLANLSPYDLMLTVKLLYNNGILIVDENNKEIKL